jgi:hypothetical protein
MQDACHEPPMNACDKIHKKVRDQLWKYLRVYMRLESQETEIFAKGIFSEEIFRCMQYIVLEHIERNPDI